MTTKLEPVFLTNVLLYIDTLDTIQTFITVSKHCLEASLILKYYSKRFVQTSPKSKNFNENESYQNENQKSFDKISENFENSEKSEISLNSQNDQITHFETSDKTHKILKYSEITQLSENEQSDYFHWLSSQTFQKLHKSIPSNLFNIFPNIQTIRCTYNDLFDKNTKETLSKCHRIELDANSSSTIIPEKDNENESKNQNMFFCNSRPSNVRFHSDDVELSLREKVVSVRLFESSESHENDFHFEFQESLVKVFPSCEKIVFCPNKHEKRKMYMWGQKQNASENEEKTIVEKILGENRNVSLKEFIVINPLCGIYGNGEKDDKEIMKQMEQYEVLKEYKFINRKVCYFKQQQNEEIIKKLNEIFDEVYCSSFETIDVEEYYPLNTQMIDLYELKRKVLSYNAIGYNSFEKHQFLGREDLLMSDKEINILKGKEIDLRKHKDLERIEMMDCQTISNHPKIFVDGLNKLKTISFGKIGMIQMKENQMIINVYDNENNCKFWETIVDLKQKQFDEVELHMKKAFESSVEYMKSLIEYCPNIQQKKVCFTCDKYQPTKEIIDKLKAIENVQIQINYSVQWGNINDIPENENTLIIESYNFYSYCITNQKVYDQITTIYLYITACNIDIDLSQFINCKKMIMFSDNGEEYYSTSPKINVIQFPPHIEEFEYLSTYKKSFELPNNHYKSMKLLKYVDRSGFTSKKTKEEKPTCEITNLKELTIDSYELVNKQHIVLSNGKKMKIYNGEVLLIGDFKKYETINNQRVEKKIKLNELETLLGGSEIELDELEYHYTIRKEYKDKSILNAMKDISQSYPNIKKKKIYLYISSWYMPYCDIPCLEWIETLSRNPSIELHVTFLVSWGNINDIPEEQHTLVLDCFMFSSHYITNPKVFEQIDTIKWYGPYDHDEGAWGEVDFSGFVNCKRMMIKLDDGDIYPKITLPPNLEELIYIYDCPYTTTGNGLTNLEELKCLKRFIFFAGLTGEHFKFMLPKNHFELIQTDQTREIINLDEVTFDRMEVVDYYGYPVD